jgi:hypothetical protein
LVRVAVYVDGFNLYFGLRAKYDRKYLWLDVQKLADSLVRSGQNLAFVRYFTARVRRDVEGQQRQSDYLDALRERSPLVKIKDGRFQDLCPAVRETKSLFPAKRIIAAFPPGRQSAELKRVVDGFMFIGEDKVRQAQLPDEVVAKAGVVLRRRSTGPEVRSYCSDAECWLQFVDGPLAFAVHHQRCERE